jgi:hypothetical protein
MYPLQMVRAQQLFIKKSPHIRLLALVRRFSCRRFSMRSSTSAVRALPSAVYPRRANSTGLRDATISGVRHA